MNKKQAIFMVVTMVLTVFLGTIMTSPSYALEKKTFILAHTGAADSSNEHFAQAFKKILTAKSGGNLTIDIYNSSQLGSDKDTATNVKAGKVDFQISTPAAMLNEIPAVSVFDIPWMFKNTKEARKAVHEKNFFGLLSKEYEKAGFKILSFSDQGFRVITTNKNITGIDSFKGMSLRTMDNKNQIAFFNAIGIKSTPLNTSEVYLALQQGMLQGQENPYNQVYDKKLFEVQKYLTNSNHIYYISSLTTGTASWAKLSPEAQKIVMASAIEAAKENDKYSDSSEEKFRQKLTKELKMQFIDFDKIKGLREELHKKTFNIAKNNAAKSVPPALLDAYLKASGLK
jgi:tripartite ATP-independent transporter DctP family solute receptor